MSRKAPASLGDPSRASSPSRPSAMPVDRYGQQRQAVPFQRQPGQGAETDDEARHRDLIGRHPAPCQRAGQGVQGAFDQAQCPAVKHQAVSSSSKRAAGGAVGRVVGHQQCRYAQVGDACEHPVTKALAQCLVQLGEGFVEQNQLRFGQQGAQQADAGALSAGEGRHVAFALAFQPGPGQRRLDAFVFLPAAQTGRQGERQVVEHIEVREQQVVLEQNADASVLDRHIVQDAAIETNDSIGAGTPVAGCRRWPPAGSICRPRWDPSAVAIWPRVEADAQRLEQGRPRSASD